MRRIAAPGVIRRVTASPRLFGSGVLGGEGMPEEASFDTFAKSQMKAPESGTAMQADDIEGHDPLDAALSSVRREKDDAITPATVAGGAQRRRRKRTMDDILGDVLVEAISLKDKGEKPDVDAIYRRTQERLYEAEHGRKAPSSAAGREQLQRKYLPFPPVMGMYRVEAVAGVGSAGASELLHTGAVYHVTKVEELNHERRRDGRGRMRAPPAPQESADIGAGFALPPSASAVSFSFGPGSSSAVVASKDSRKPSSTLAQELLSDNTRIFESERAALESFARSQETGDVLTADATDKSVISPVSGSYGKEDPWPARAITVANPILSRAEADRRAGEIDAKRDAIGAEIRAALKETKGKGRGDGAEERLLALWERLCCDDELSGDFMRMFMPRCVLALKREEAKDCLLSMLDDANAPVFVPSAYFSLEAPPPRGVAALKAELQGEFADALEEHAYWERQFIVFIRDVPLWQRRSLPFLHEHYRFVTHRLLRAEFRFAAARDVLLLHVLHASPDVFSDTERRVDRSRGAIGETHKSLSSPNYDPIKTVERQRSKAERRARYGGSSSSSSTSGGGADVSAGEFMAMTDAEFVAWEGAEHDDRQAMLARIFEM